MFSSFMNYEDHNKGADKENKKDRPLHVCEIMGLLLCLCIEESFQTQRVQILTESLQKLEQFVKVFLLACSRDGLKKSEHGYRIMDLPKNTVYHLIHFLYVMLESGIAGFVDEKTE